MNWRKGIGQRIESITGTANANVAVIITVDPMAP